MRNLLILLLSIISTSNAQPNIKLNIKYFNSQPDGMYDEINIDSIKNIYSWYFNDSIISSTNLNELRTNYPQFDKLVLVNKERLDTTIIYSILKPTQYFEIYLDIKFDGLSLDGNTAKKYPSSIENLDENEYDSLFRIIEYGTIQFLGKNIPSEFNLIGTYGSNLGTSTGVKVENKKTKFQLLPFHFGYNPNATIEVIIGEYEKIENEVADSLHQKYETVYYLLNSNQTDWTQQKAVKLIKTKHKFYIRLFNNENVIIEYNYLTNKYTLNKI